MVEAPEHRRTSSLHNVTNTLIVTKVPPSLLHSSVTPSLKEFFARHGNIEAWVPLSSFERVVVVYSTVEAAERAKEGMDWTLVEGFGSTSSNTSRLVVTLRLCIDVANLTLLRLQHPQSLQRPVYSARDTAKPAIATASASPREQQEFPHFTTRIPARWLGADSRGSTKYGDPRERSGDRAGKSDYAQSL